jgi:hypothetical protein
MQQRATVKIIARGNYVNRVKLTFKPMRSPSR